MPHLSSKGALHMLLHPQDIMRSWHKEDGGGWCIPHRRASRLPLEAVKQLAGDVNELIMKNPEMTMAGPDSPESHANNSADCLHVSEDVRKQLQTILGLIKKVTDDAGEKQTQKYVLSSDAVESLEQLIAADLPVQLLSQLPVVAFEARKDIMNVCCALLWSGMPQQVDRQIVEYFRDHPRFFKLLVDGYAYEELALHYGVVLRSCARHKKLVRAFFISGQVLELVKHTRQHSIDISSDAFYSLREMMLEHKDVSSAWLSNQQNFEDFFRDYNEILRSGQYFAERQAQKLLAEILLDRHFRSSMMSYVNSERNLQIHMILLKDKSKVIQVDAFHVFKIFAANPQKTSKVQKILVKNKEKLLALLETLPSARPNDKKLAEEVRNVADKLRALEAPVSPAMLKVPSDPALTGGTASGSECARSEGARSEVSTTASTSL